MNKKIFGLTPLLAVVIQLLLITIINCIEKLFVTQPEAHGPCILNYILLFGLTESIIGYFVAWVYNITKKRRYWGLLVYSILYCTLGIILGASLGYMNDRFIWIVICLVPVTLYLLPYIWGTVKFDYKQ